MEESKMFRMAALAVLNSRCIEDEDKLDILRVLFNKEDVALMIEEKKQEKENG